MDVFETTAERLLREVRERNRMFEGSSIVKTLRGYRGPADVLRESILNSPLSIVEQFAQKQRVGAADTVVKTASNMGAARSRESRSSTVQKSPRTGTIRRIADLGPMIRAARKAMKLNQADFAAHAGVGRRFLSELESGKPSLEFDKVIACATTAGIDIFARARRL